MVTINNRWRRWGVLALVNLSVLVGLYVATEAGLHLYSWDTNPLTAGSPPRIRHPVFNHTLRPNFSGPDHWFPTVYFLKTNSLGFKDLAVRDVPMASDRKRIVFIGDSFTEGVGLPYEETFVGRFAAAFPELDVLNAGVVSYAPSVYYEKIKYYLDAGLKFDEAIVYIDISDIQDEAMHYSYDAKGVLRWSALPDENEAALKVPERCSLRRETKKDWWEKTFYVADFLNQLRMIETFKAALPHVSLEDLIKYRLAYYPDYDRAAWTYSDNVDCFGKDGVEGGIDKARNQMDRLYKLLSDHGVALSVGVYPWPHQLLYDVENSRQAQIWRDWCAGKCRRFFDHFPAFFRVKEQDPNFIKTLFIWGDVHYNAQGNKIFADDLIAQYRRAPSSAAEPASASASR
jgi:hypothetical protein